MDRICNSTFELEPHLLAILELVKSAPELRPEFAGCFIECIGERPNPYDLLLFCMRDLQWPEVREAVEAKQDESRDWRIKTWLSHVAEVYAAAWEDADLWNYYGGEAPA